MSNCVGSSGLGLPASAVARHGVERGDEIAPQFSGQATSRHHQVEGPYPVVLPKRWIVERTLAWISRCRRLARDYERHARKAAAFVRLAMIRLMLRRLA